MGSCSKQAMGSIVGLTMLLIGFVIGFASIIVPYWIYGKTSSEIVYGGFWKICIVSLRYRTSDCGERPLNITAAAQHAGNNTTVTYESERVTAAARGYLLKCRVFMIVGIVGIGLGITRDIYFRVKNNHKRALQVCLVIIGGFSCIFAVVQFYLYWYLLQKDTIYVNTSLYFCYGMTCVTGIFGVIGGLLLNTFNTDTCTNRSANTCENIRGQNNSAFSDGTAEVSVKFEL